MAEVSEKPADGPKDDITILREFVKEAELKPEIDDYDELSDKFTAAVTGALARYIESQNQLRRRQLEKKSNIVSKFQVKDGDNQFVGKVIGTSHTNRPIQVEMNGAKDGEIYWSTFGVGGFGAFSAAYQGDMLYYPYLFAPRFREVYGVRHAADRFYDTPYSSITGVELASRSDAKTHLNGFYRVTSRLIDGLITR